ncbi:MAG: tRNA (adenosine(37)-N6)-dimethylallyltransferase MiaA [Clostridia bacterium]|nr:tRNA (adenosine(37)-N6)-dimethylallyltransferase MiaA [Clostridia bacterium]
MNKLITVIGTTASGKSSLGIELADIFGGEIVSADSRQIYRKMDLGTGKITPEEGARVKHHLIDILDAGEPFSMADFQGLAYEAIDSIIEKGKTPFLVGGTGLYTRSVVEGYNLSDVVPDEGLRDSLLSKSRDELCEMLKELGESEIPGEYSPRRLIRMIEKRQGGTSSENENSPRYEVLQLAMTYPRDVLYRRISERLDARIAEGMIDEIRSLYEGGVSADFLERLGLEYRYTYRYIAGMYPSFEDYRAELYKEICHFAKRQMTWFKKEKNVVWLNTDGDFLKEAKDYVQRFISGEKIEYKPYE